MADHYSNEGSSTSNTSVEGSDATVELNVKTLDSQIYSFHVDINVRINLNGNVYLNLCHFFSFSLHRSNISVMIALWMFQMPVQAFKEKIASEIGVPVGQQRLIFRGKVLKDEHLLSEYRIQSFSVIHKFMFIVLFNIA